MVYNDLCFDLVITNIFFCVPLCWSFDFRADEQIFNRGILLEINMGFRSVIFNSCCDHPFLCDDNDQFKKSVKALIQSP